jgi:hypothetical protein
MLKGKQKKLDVNKDGKISGKDFAVLKAEKAKGRGMGLQDEKLPPGKMLKAKIGAFGIVGEEDQSSSSMEGLGSIASPAEPTPADILTEMDTPPVRQKKKFARKLGGKMGGGMIDPTMANYKKGGSVIAKVKLGRTRPTKLY